MQQFHIKTMVLKEPWLPVLMLDPAPLLGPCRLAARTALPWVVQDNEPEHSSKGVTADKPLRLRVL